MDSGGPDSSIGGMLSRYVATPVFEDEESIFIPGEYAFVMSMLYRHVELTAYRNMRNVSRWLRCELG